MRSAEELNQKLTVSERQCNEHYARVQALEYQLGEVLGCLDEYAAMPCASLRARLVQAGRRAQQVLKPLPPGCYTAKLAGARIGANGEPIVEVDWSTVEPIEGKA